MHRSLIFVAKQPVPGQVKTRIGATIGAEAAAELYRCALEDTAALVESLDVEHAISCAPPDDDLIGMRKPHPILFERIAWSAEVVADQTHERAIEGGLRLVDVPTWYDLDTADDLCKLYADVTGTADNRAPRTRAFIERADLIARFRLS